MSILCEAFAVHKLFAVKLFELHVSMKSAIKTKFIVIIITIRFICTVLGLELLWLLCSQLGLSKLYRVTLHHHYTAKWITSCCCLGRKQKKTLTIAEKYTFFTVMNWVSQPEGKYYSVVWSHGSGYFRISCRTAPGWKDCGSVGFCPLVSFVLCAAFQPAETKTAVEPQSSLSERHL